MNLNETISAQKQKFASLTSNLSPNNRTLIESNLKRLEEIEKKLKVESYRLVFIGEPGSGKTTIICNYLKLIREMQVGGEFKAIELFDTAFGRTTAFEVHYLKAETTGFKIYPMDLRSQYTLIKEYCEYIWEQAFKNSQDDERTESKDKDSNASREGDRIIRNMLGFPSTSKMKEYVQKNYEEHECQKFVEDMFTKSRIASRECTTICCPEDVDTKKWIKSTFNNINFGKNPDVAIPERVDVFLNPDDLDYSMPEFVSEVIDTRGYDGNAREDLRNYFEADDTLCVILDKVETLPGERQRKILTEWINAVDTDSIHKNALMINVRNKSLAHVPEADGDPEKGKELKLEELERAIVDNNLKYQIQNTLFVNPYAGITYDSEDTICKINKETRLSEQQRITNHFLQMIQQYNEALSEEAEKITKDTEQLFTDISVSANKLTALKERIKTLWDTLKQQISDFFLESELNFCNYFRENIHWRSAKAMVSREGHWTNAPIYHEYADYCQRHVTQESERILKQMRGYVEELKNDDDSDEMTAFVNSCINKMESEYKNLLKHIWSETYSLCDNALTSTFWQSDAQVQSGSGYYDRLMKAIRIQMRRTGLAVKTNDKILELTDRFFNEILQAIEE